MPPPGITRVLKSKACRSALMFGHPLLLSEGQALVSQLLGTQLCFCCAHGRPTTAPLVDLTAVRQFVAWRAVHGRDGSGAGGMEGGACRTG